MWKTFVLFVKNFLGDKKARNYAELVTIMLLDSHERPPCLWLLLDSEKRPAYLWLLLDSEERPACLWLLLDSEVASKRKFVSWILNNESNLHVITIWCSLIILCSIQLMHCVLKGIISLINLFRWKILTKFNRCHGNVICFVRLDYCN